MAGSAIGDFRTRTAIASGQILKGQGVIRSADANGMEVVAATTSTTAAIHGIATTLAGDGDIVEYYEPGSHARVACVAAVSDLTVMLKVTTNGFTPCTSGTSMAAVIPLQTAAAGTSGTPSYIDAIVWPTLFVV